MQNECDAETLHNPTTVRMAKRYGHIGQEAQRQAVATLSGASFERQYPQNPPQISERSSASRANSLRRLAPRARFELATLRLTGCGLKF